MKYLGAPVSFWKTLCLFTYYLFDHDQLAIFENFIQQFVCFIHINSIGLTKSDFLAFMKTTLTYFSNKQRILTKPSALITFIRMMGVLPLTKENFSWTDNYARQLSNLILNKVSQQFNSIFEQVNAEEWNTFKDGLVILMTIEIYNDKESKTDLDSISLLFRIPENNNQKDQIANLFFNQLMQLKSPIEQNSWTKLLPLINNDKLDFNCLSLANSFDQMISCFEHLLSLYQIDDEITRTIIRIFNTKLNINLHAIVQILEYLERQPLTNVEPVQAIQHAIESNEEFRRRIERYLNNLNIQMTHLKLLQDLFRSYNPNFLSNLDKTTYLIQTLNSYEKRSYEFYILWFECFLCDEHFVQTEEKFRQFEKLLKEWLNKFRYDRQLLEQMTMKIDVLLDKLTAIGQNKPNDRRGNLFIKQLIDIYFQQSKLLISEDVQFIL